MVSRDFAQFYISFIFPIQHQLFNVRRYVWMMGSGWFVNTLSVVDRNGEGPMSLTIIFLTISRCLLGASQ